MPWLNQLDLHFTVCSVAQKKKRENYESLSVGGIQSWSQVLSSGIILSVDIGLLNVIQCKLSSRILFLKGHFFFSHYSDNFHQLSH